MTTIGFIGLGNMGSAAARNLQRAGFKPAHAPN
ncbi:MAG: NAD(P)-binding domain-containing protein [Anaerolineae bacterium]|nr:NAD(P)-binding domain-containing protein [Anaerolineae bacterium]